ncbi:MAG: tetratricopeptide repeat protein [Planctomycetes bacterium]|nr:tetratricopeptide repeat protein [Planctomycetota bacterium]
MAAPNDSFAAAEERFHAWLEAGADAAARAAIVRSARDEDAELGRLLDLLIRGYTHLEPGFLEPADEEGLAGSALGGFVLSRVLARGGMGVVYEAEQAAPRRTVAVKIVRVADGRAADVEREAALLARLSHPNVAQVHAAGALERGGRVFAWFAMELVSGARSITRFADEAALDLDARLALFLDACAALQHAHQRGVLHLDVKPSNLLVDDAGTVKVIDFGIGRARGADDALGFAGAGTFVAMAPEQLDPDAVIDARADVHGLGAVLCELVAGRPLRALDGLAPDAATRRVRKPVELALGADVPSDLAAIVARAVAHDAGDRYAGIAELAEDVRRFRACEPVRARPPSVFRRLALFVRRRRALAAAAVLVALALAGGSTAALVSAVRARDALAAETRARARAERVLALHERIFAAYRPGNALGREVDVRAVLDGALAACERELAGDPSALAEMLGVLAATRTELGDLARAKELFERALELAPVREDGSVDAPLRSSFAYALIQLGERDRARSELEQALPVLRADPAARAELGLALYRASELARLSGDAVSARARLDEALALCGDERTVLRARVLEQLGAVEYRARDLARAEELHREALAIGGERLPELHPARASMENSLAGDLFERGKVQEAREHWERALATFEQVLDATHPDLATVLGNLALARERTGDLDGAIELHERALAARRAALGEAHPRVAGTLRNLAMACLARKDLARAEACARDAIAVDERACARPGAPCDGADLGQDYLTLGIVLRERRDLDGAMRAAQECVRQLRAALPAGHADLAQPLTLLGSTLVDLGRAAEAEPLLREALELRRAKLPGSWLAANSASVLGGALVELGRHAEAEELLAPAAEALAKALGPRDFRVRDAWKRLATLFERTGRTESATELRERAAGP